jgi:hypothetical protein
MFAVGDIRLNGGRMDDFSVFIINSPDIEKDDAFIPSLGDNDHLLIFDPAASLPIRKKPLHFWERLRCINHRHGLADQFLPLVAQCLKGSMIDIQDIALGRNDVTIVGRILKELSKSFFRGPQGLFCVFPDEGTG